VTTTSSRLLQRDYLRITELMYHPPAPSAAEIAAGFTSAEDFEYIELMIRRPQTSLWWASGSRPG
jgi:hypothetical protein